MEKPITELIDYTKILYKSIGSVHCTALHLDVVFNKHGLNHLFRKGNGHRRTENDIRNRLRIFKYVPDVIKNCIWPSFPTNGKTGNKEADARVSYHELYYTIREWYKKEHITVVIRKFDQGNWHYYSLKSNVKFKQKTKKTF